MCRERRPEMGTEQDLFTAIGIVVFLLLVIGLGQKRRNDGKGQENQ
jgi:hypothetical protein